MTTSQMPQTQASSNDAVISVGQLAYYNQRLRNRIFEDVLKAFIQEAKAGRITKARLAKRLGKKPAQITRWLSGPSNWTLDTISALLLGIGAELDSEVAFLRDRTRPNYAHPFIEQFEGRAEIGSAPPPPALVSFDDLRTPPSSSSTNMVLTIMLAPQEPAAR